MPQPPNAEQSEYWNHVAGPNWVALQERLDAQLGALGTPVLERGALSPGDRVLDVGCGCGASSLEAAARVAPGGTVLGLDLSEPMLARARQRAEEAGAKNVRFERADVQTQAPPPGSMDVVISRFGVMFFASPEAAFTGLREALVAAGRLAFVCWQPMERNPWMAVPAAAVGRLVPLPAPAAPGSPGPFAFSDPDRVRRILDAAGFVEGAVDAFEGDLLVGGARTLDAAGALAIEMGPAARALREAGADAALRRKAADAAAEALRPFDGPDGVRAPFAAWIVTARAPR